MSVEYVFIYLVLFDFLHQSFVVFLDMDPLYIWLHLSLRILLLLWAMVHGIVFVNLDADCLLLVYKKEIHLHILTLYLEIFLFLHVLISSRKGFLFVFLVNPFKFST